MHDWDLERRRPGGRPIRPTHRLDCPLCRDHITLDQINAGHQSRQPWYWTIGDADYHHDLIYWHARWLRETGGKVRPPG